MAKFVAVSLDGHLGIHAPSAKGDYATLCGLDGDDPSLDMHPAKVPKGARIDCGDCRAIWEAAKTLKKSDFAGNEA